MIERQKDIVMLLLDEVQELATEMSSDPKKDLSKFKLFQKVTEKLDEITDPKEMEEKLLDTCKMYTTLRSLSSVLDEVKVIGTGPTPSLKEEAEEIEGVFKFFGKVQKNLEMPKFDGSGIDEEKGEKDEDPGLRGTTDK